MEDPANPSPELMAECASMFFGGAIVDKELKANPAVHAELKEMEQRFTHAIGTFRELCPSPYVKKLGEMLWQIIEHKVVFVSVGPNVPTMTFVMVRDRDDVEQAAIVLPRHWLRMLALDPIMQAGALAWNGSKALDYYNKMPIESWDERGAVYESELLHVIKSEMPDHIFSPYQASVMAKYPKGWETPEAAPLKYESKPFHLAQA